MKQVVFYKDNDGNEPVKIWLDTLDKSFVNRIIMRLIRIENGNFGDVKKIDNDISELRFDFGKGYRIYYSEIDNIVVILLNAGDKKQQSKDIKKAKENFENWRKHNGI